MASAPTVVVGAGPAGLAAGAMLRGAGADVLVLERGDRLGASRRGHYRSLRLHTVRSLSALPGAPLPRSYGRWVAGTDFLAYLERYAERKRLEIRTGTDVRRVDARGGGFVLGTDSEPIPAAAVVVATGYNREPVVPDWVGADRRVAHSSGYRDAGPYRGRAVLVVGAGNSESDIALDLAGGDDVFTATPAAARCRSSTTGSPAPCGPGPSRSCRPSRGSTARTSCCAGARACGPTRSWPSRATAPRSYRSSATCACSAPRGCRCGTAAPSTGRPRPAFHRVPQPDDGRAARAALRGPGDRRRSRG
jgi:hypothetical protein